MRSNEKNFIRRLQSEKEDALDYVVDMYLPLVKGIVHKVLVPFQNEGLIEECVNDTFLSIWNHADSFQGEIDDFEKWICAIAKFKAIDYYRKAMKNNEYSSDSIERIDGNVVEEEVIREENKDELMKLIYKLDPVDQKIFVMKFLLGLRSEEIAEKLLLTKSSVDNRIYRGKKKLKKYVYQLNWEVI